MSAKTNVIVMAKPSDAAEALRSERERIVADLETISRKLARLAEAQKDEERIFAEIAKLGEKEIEAVKVWVASGCEGPQPQPDAGERARLTKRMAAAVDAARTAKAVAGEVEAEAVTLRARLAQIDAEMRTLKIASLESQFVERVSDFEAIASKMRITLREIRSLPLALAELGRTAVERDDHDYARALFGAAERMRGARLPEVEPSDAEILQTISRLTGMIRSGGEPRLVDNEADIAADPAPAQESGCAARRRLRGKPGCQYPEFTWAHPVIDQLDRLREYAAVVGINDRAAALRIHEVIGVLESLMLRLDALEVAYGLPAVERREDQHLNA